MRELPTARPPVAAPSKKGMGERAEGVVQWLVAALLRARVQGGE